MTAAQRRAINRRNAHKSTGPNTLEGKERARQNALKHGLCAATLALSIENAADLQDQFDEWVASYQPVGPAEFAMVEEIAIAQLRLRRCRRRETAVVELQLHAAEEVWYKEQEDRLDAARALLATDPAAAEDLWEFGAGRRWLIDCWTQLGETLLRDRYVCAAAWIDESVRFLGGDPAQPAAGPLLAYEFRLACTGVRPDPDQKVLAWLLSDAAIHPDYLAQHGREVPAGADCRDRIDQIIAAEIAALQQEENDGQEDEEEEELDDARRRAQVPSDGPDTKLSLRYEATARAALHKALKALDQLQDARYAAEAEAGEPDVIALADTPPGPLPSIARNEPEPPAESQPSADSQTSCDSSTEANSAEAATVTATIEEVAGVAAVVTAEISATVLPIVMPGMADSPPA